MAGVRMRGECALVVWFLGLRGRGLCLDGAGGVRGFTCVSSLGRMKGEAGVVCLIS
jgi:hypothetical protein